MARGERILAGYPRIGGSPDGGMTLTLSQLIGYEKTMRFLLENATIDADEALRLGIVGEVVDAERFEARLAEYCQQIAKVSPITSRLTKRTVGEGHGDDRHRSAASPRDSAASAAHSAATTARKRARRSSKSAPRSSKAGNSRPDQ